MSSRKADGPARGERAVGRWNARRSPRRAGQTSIQRDGKGEWEMAKRWICLWAALVLALMGVCLCVAVWDGVAWARTGEFQLLPALNVTRFRSDGSLDEEDAQALTGASSFLDELYETGHDERDPLRKFVNVSTWLALLDLPFFYCGSWACACRAGRRSRSRFPQASPCCSSPPRVSARGAAMAASSSRHAIPPPLSSRALCFFPSPRCWR